MPDTRPRESLVEPWPYFTATVVFSAGVLLGSLLFGRPKSCIPDTCESRLTYVRDGYTCGKEHVSARLDVDASGVPFLVCLCE